MNDDLSLGIMNLTAKVSGGREGKQLPVGAVGEVSYALAVQRKSWPPGKADQIPEEKAPHECSVRMV